MRKIKYCFFIALVLLFLTSCFPKKSGDKEITNLNGLTWEGETIIAELNQAETFSFSGRITVSRGATWNLYIDEAGKNPVTSKTLNLSEGENRAYIIVKAEDGSTKVYPVIIINHTNPAIRIHYQPQDPNFTETQTLSPSTVLSHDETLADLLPTLTLNGHRFLGWYYDEARTQLVNPSDSLTADITLYAKWEYLPLKIKWIDGSNETETDSFYSDTIHEPSVASKEGYVFLGWFSDLTDAEPVSFPMVLTDHLELYAKWEEEKFRVSFVTNGDTTISDQIVGYWQGLTEPSVPEKAGHSFKGWYTDSGLSGPIASFPLAVRSDLTLYGAWEINSYTVKFVTDTDQTIDDLIVEYQTKISRPTELLKPGYKFEGWYDNPEMSGLPVAFPYPVLKETTLYARWTYVKTVSEGLVFALNEDGESYQLTGYTGSDATVLVPETFNNKPVTRINQTAFADNNKIYRVLLPDTIEKIDARAFQNCLSLRSMILPKNLKVLETETFINCDSLEFVMVNELLETIEANPFYDCKSLKSVSFKGNPSNVNNWVFNRTPIKSMIIACEPGSEVARIATELYEVTVNKMIDLKIAEPVNLAEQWNALQPYYEFFNQSGDKTPREADYNQFASEKSEKTLSVFYSEELYYAVVHGFKPLPAAGSPAEEIYQKAKQVLRTIIYREMDDIQKLLAINDWLAQNVAYDHDLLEKVFVLEQDPENPENFQTIRYTSFYLDGVFKDGIAVCDGYAKAFHFLCALEDIVAERIVGDVNQNGVIIGHAWNKVLLDGEWLIVDSTWNDTRILFEGSKEFMLHQYFLVPEEVISDTHIEEDPIIYQVSTTSDDFYAYYRLHTFTVDDFQGDFYLDSVEELIKLMVSQIGKVATGQALEVYFGFDYGDSMEDEFWEAFKAFPECNDAFNPLYLTSSGIVLLVRK